MIQSGGDRLETGCSADSETEHNEDFFISYLSGPAKSCNYVVSAFGILSHASWTVTTVYSVQGVVAT